MLNGSDKYSGTWTRQNNKNSDEKSVPDYVLEQGEFYEYITKMNIDEDKFICPFRTTTSKTGSVITTNSDHNSIVVDLRIEKDSTRPKKSADKSRWKFTKEGLRKLRILLTLANSFAK